MAEPEPAPLTDPGRLFGPQWKPRSLTRVLEIPAWVHPAHLPFEAVPRERRSGERAKSNRVFWRTPDAAGLRVDPEETAWTLDGLRGLQLYNGGSTPGFGWVELRLLWTSTPDWATLLVQEPWGEEARARFEELGVALSAFLGVPFERFTAEDV